MRVVGYVRVSTEEQASEGVSLEAQRGKLDQYCALYALDLFAIEADAGVSAKSLDRPGLRLALDRLDRGEGSGLVIAKLDRLSRSVADWNRLIDGYFGPSAGKQLFSVADSIDTRTAAGRLVLNVLMSVAQWEREANGERTRDALAHKRSQGERVGTIPLGHDLADDGRTLIPNASEQATIGLIRELAAAGLGPRPIASELNRRGIPSKSGGRWWHSAVARVLARLSEPPPRPENPLS